MCGAGLLVSCQSSRVQALTAIASEVMMRKGMISAKDVRDLNRGAVVLFGSRLLKEEEGK